MIELPLNKYYCFIVCNLLLLNINAQTYPYQLQILEDDHKLIVGGMPADPFYAIDSIKIIELWFDDPDWYDQMVINYYHDEEMAGTMIYDGDTIPSHVGVSFRGHSSFYLNDAIKKSFSIKLDFEDDDQELYGYRTLNLNCSHNDPSFMREAIYENLIQQYVPALKVNYVHLYLNGLDFGLYTNVEQLNMHFINEWFLNDDGTLWRAERTDGAVDSMPGGVDGQGFSSFNYLGTDSSDYSDYYTVKSTEKDNPWEDLIFCIDALNNDGAQVIEDSLNKYLDIDRALWFLACEIVFADADSYVAKGGMDYYIYWEPGNGRILPLEYDGNSVMDSVRHNWFILLQSEDPGFALTYKLFGVPSIRQRYLAHVRTILDELFSEEVINERIEYLDGLINNYVEADPVKIYSYGDYLMELNNLKEFVVERRNFILNYWEIEQVAPTITGTKWIVNGNDWTEVLGGHEVIVNATVFSTPAPGVIYLYYAKGLSGPFTKIKMYDDSFHGDDLSGDNVYGASIPAFEAGTEIRFYIEAVASNVAGTKRYDPPGAEHDVYYYKVKNNDEVGVESALEYKFEIYPNPADQLITVVSTIAGQNHVEIFSSNGQKIWNGDVSDKIVINIIDWCPGIYLIRIGDDIKKLVVE